MRSWPMPSSVPNIPTVGEVYRRFDGWQRRIKKVTEQRVFYFAGMPGFAHTWENHIAGIVFWQEGLSRSKWTLLKSADKTWNEKLADVF